MQKKNMFVFALRYVGYSMNTFFFPLYILFTFEI